jgi:hypothetical protein
MACAKGHRVEQPAPCVLRETAVDTSKPYRLGDVLLFGEKATSTLAGQRRDVPVAGVCGVRQVQPGQRVNALGGLDVYLQPAEGVIQHLRHRGYNVLILPEIRRAGEIDWLRVEAPNRYYRKIEAADPDSNAIKAKLKRIAGVKPDSVISDTELSSRVWERSHYSGDTSKPNSHADNPGCLSHYTQTDDAEGLAPRSGDAAFPVSKMELERNQWLREGSWLPVLYFFDLVQRFDCPYLRDLRTAARQGRPVLSLSLQELPVIGSENVPQLYRARSGDRLRLRLLVAQQDVRQLDRNLELLKAERLPDVPEYRLTTRLSLADDVEFLVAEYGLKLQIVPAVSYASAATDVQADEFNPIKRAPGITSAFYLRYEGRRDWLSKLQWMPGVFASMLALNGRDTKFTAGLSWSPPELRRWVNLVYGWHDLKRPVVGLAISPSIDFKTMLAPDRPGK